MNNQLSRGGEYSSIESIIRSQKLFNHQPQHVKTQSNQPQEQRSPQPQRELRDTWRKPRLPHNKLPDAFQMRSKKKKSNREIVEQLDRMVRMNQYKQIQKYLEPLPNNQHQRAGDNNRTVQNTNTVTQNNNRREANPRMTQSNPKLLQNSNPLASYQKYLRIKNKFSQQMQQRDLSLNKYKALSTKQPAPTYKLNHCITLRLAKRGRRTGTVKTVLHVPTMTIFSIKEEPLNSREVRMAVKEVLAMRQNVLNGHRWFVQCYGGVYNAPQGAVSIMTQYCRQGSLLDLLGTVMTLPETVIRQLLLEIVEALASFYQLTGAPFGGLSPSQILITQNGKIKMGLGLFYNLPSPTSFYGLKIPSKINPLEFNATQKNFMRPQPQKSNQSQYSLDIFKLGLLMLQCAIGGFQNFQQSSVILQALKVAFGEQGQKAMQRDGVCCLVHSQAYLLNLAGQLEDRSRRDRFEMESIVSYFKFLKERFSLPFIGVLCSCLKLVHKQRSTFQQLSSHSYLRLPTPKQAKTVQISLFDLLQINSASNRLEAPSDQQSRADKLISMILHILNTCSRDVIGGILLRRQKVVQLEKEVGGVGLGQRLMMTLIAISKQKRDFTASI